MSESIVSYLLNDKELTLFKIYNAVINRCHVVIVSYHVLIFITCYL